MSFSEALKFAEGSERARDLAWDLYVKKKTER